MQITPYSQIRHEELLLRSVIRQHVKPINEGIGEELAQDAIQFAVAAAAEYAIGGAIAVGTVGVGTPAAQAIETAVDVAFTAKDVMATVESVAAAAKMLVSLQRCLITLSMASAAILMAIMKSLKKAFR